MDDQKPNQKSKINEGLNLIVDELIAEKPKKIISELPQFSSNNH